MTQGRTGASVRAPLLATALTAALCGQDTLPNAPSTRRGDSVKLTLSPSQQREAARRLDSLLLVTSELLAVLRSDITDLNRDMLLAKQTRYDSAVNTLTLILTIASVVVFLLMLIGGYFLFRSQSEMRKDLATSIEKARIEIQSQARDEAVGAIRSLCEPRITATETRLAVQEGQREAYLAGIRDAVLLQINRKPSADACSATSSPASVVENKGGALDATPRANDGNQ